MDEDNYFFFMYSITHWAYLQIGMLWQLSTPWVYIGIIVNKLLYITMFGPLCDSLLSVPINDANYDL